MPRPASHDYLKIRQLRQRAWQENSQLPTPNYPWELHGYFQSTKDLPDNHPLLIRKLINENPSSLPQRAGRNFTAYHAAEKPGRRPERFNEVIAYVVSKYSAQHGTEDKKGRLVTAQVLDKPEIDVDRPARLLLDMVETMPRDQLDHLAKDGEELTTDLKIPRKRRPA